MTKENTRKEVQDYCVKVGSNRLFTQGAGGNVSWKDGNLLYIKASGTWLADANDKDIFLINRTDEFLSEYIAPYAERLKWNCSCTNSSCL